jgi:hypothetical protein
MVYNSHFSDDREKYLRSLAIRLHISKNDTADIDSVMPTNLMEGEKKHRQHDDQKEFEFIITGLLPLYQARLSILINQPSNILLFVKEVIQKSNLALKGRYGNSDNFSSEIANLYISIFKWSKNCSKEELNEFFILYIKNNTFIRVNQKINLIRIAYRLAHLRTFAKEYEGVAFRHIKSFREDGPEESAHRYIALSRAVLVVSSDDASVYFEYAIEIVSKFGDEIYQRWEATQAIAKQAVNNTNPVPELAYRFIRVAELVGENLREKHWDRGEAVQVCTRLCTSSGIAALSRWRERDIGRFEWVESALIQELLYSEKISIHTAIALATFLNIDQIRNIVGKLIESPVSLQAKKILVDQLLPRVQKEGASQEYWISLKESSDRAGIKNNALDDIINSFTKEMSLEKKSEVRSLQEKEDKAFDWEKIFLDSDLCTVDELSTSLAKFEMKIEDRNPWIPKSEFWKNVLNRIEENDIYNFLGNSLNVRNISLHDIEEIFQELPSDWKSKVSFKKKLFPLLFSIGQKFAQELVISWHYKSTIEKISLDGEQILALQSGIFEGLAAGNEFVDAEKLFGFAVISSCQLTQGEALDLLDYTLSRFELHIDEDFGDGLPDPTYNDVLDISRSTAGFIWSSLASPKSEIRWKAAHCVRELFHNDCNEIIDHLFYWLEQDSARQFGVKNYPFYNLHARLYLFIALSRVSLEKASSIEKHAAIVKYYALNEKHILIQKFAADIALNIIKNTPRIYTAEEVNSLSKVTKSDFPIETVDYNYQTDSYLHAEEEVEKKDNFYFGYDFDNYWFKPLGDVFGISEKQVEDLAAIVVEEKWGTISGGYNEDPRVGLWNSSSDHSTHNYKSSYPQTDRLDFYISYHSLMVVAAQLLEKMPTVIRRDWSNDDWNEWLSSHLLTSPDGKWLSDFRDPVPITSPSWVKSNYNDNKQLLISDNEFMDSLIEKRNGETWLNIQGSWQESNSTIKGTYYVSSALVSPGSSEALLNALSTCVDSRDYKLPSYTEKRMEIKSIPFMLKGWIKDTDISKRLDEFDPFAGEIRFPPYELGKKIIKKLNLSVSDNGKKIYFNTSTEPSVINLLYASYNSSRDDEPQHVGNRMMATLPFLKQLCNDYKCEIIFKVILGRNQIYRRYMDDHKYKESVSKIFILSPDGKIRSISESHQLG